MTTDTAMNATAPSERTLAERIRNLVSETERGGNFTLDPLPVLNIASDVDATIKHLRADLATMRQREIDDCRKLVEVAQEADKLRARIRDLEARPVAVDREALIMVVCEAFAKWEADDRDVRYPGRVIIDVLDAFFAARPVAAEPKPREAVPMEALLYNTLMGIRDVVRSVLAMDRGMIDLVDATSMGQAVERATKVLDGGVDPESNEKQPPATTDAGTGGELESLLSQLRHWANIDGGSWLEQPAVTPHNLNARQGGILVAELDRLRAAHAAVVKELRDAKILAEQGVVSVRELCVKLDEFKAERDGARAELAPLRKELERVSGERDEWRRCAASAANALAGYTLVTVTPNTMLEVAKSARQQLEAALDVKHAKLVEVADKLRDVRAQLAARRIPERPSLADQDWLRHEVERLTNAELDEEDAVELFAGLRARFQPEQPEQARPIKPGRVRATVEIDSDGVWFWDFTWISFDALEGDRKGGSISSGFRAWRAAAIAGAQQPVQAETGAAAPNHVVGSDQMLSQQPPAPRLPRVGDTVECVTDLDPEFRRRRVTEVQSSGFFCGGHWYAWNSSNWRWPAPQPESEPKPVQYACERCSDVGLILLVGSHTSHEEPCPECNKRLK